MSGVLSGFSSDIFISYSHIDNEPFGEDKKRWVSDFHRDLEIRVNALMGQRASVWRDPKLTGTDIVCDEISHRLQRAGVLVSVLSPGYLASEWCKRELGEFQEGSERNGGLRLGNKLRIVKVLKTHVSRDRLPEVLDAVLGFEFYGQDGREFHLELSSEARRAYWTKLDDVAQEVRSILERIATRSGGLKADLPAIYLAEATSDVQSKRDRLRRELQDRGYEILPVRSLPNNATEFCSAVRADLGRSKISVHLLGAEYGPIPEGVQQSTIALQITMAIERGLPRILWVPPVGGPIEHRQQEFLASIREHSGSQGELELVEGSLEGLKTIVLDKLHATEHQRKGPRQADGPLRVYILCERRDRGEAVSLRNYLIQMGIEGILPLMSGNATEIREDHEENLLTCDGAIVFWGVAEEFWVRGKLRDLIRARGLGRSAPFACKFVYLSTPETPPKKELVTTEVNIVRSLVELGALIKQAGT